ncbi:hypothetical protein PVAP13_5NG332200 [Panicum virgatum]|uniref:Uncharacterized protein n=1 Tax=Panicum virgatum TaxID=38727 RepID=A0A8T0RUI7_PANVG|nr:hypothetical protein PVAP13_5NG332200 [Panicum virgatum]
MSKPYDTSAPAAAATPPAAPPPFHLGASSCAAPARSGALSLARQLAHRPILLTRAPPHPACSRAAPPHSPHRGAPPLQIRRGRDSQHRRRRLGCLAEWRILPSGSDEGATRSTGGTGWAASRSGGSSPPDPTRAATAGAATGRAAGAAAAGLAGDPHLVFWCGCPFSHSPCPPLALVLGSRRSRTARCRRRRGSCELSPSATMTASSACATPRPSSPTSAASASTSPLPPPLSHLSRSSSPRFGAVPLAGRRRYLHHGEPPQAIRRPRPSPPRLLFAGSKMLELSQVLITMVFNTTKEELKFQLFGVAKWSLELLLLSLV